MAFAASELEFRQRFWVIGAIFGVAFAAYFVDPLASSIAVARLLGVDQRWILAGGTLLVACGAFLRSWAEAWLHSSIVHDAKLHSDTLVADGPYRRVRNPLYLGAILLAAGLGVMASRVGFVVLVGGMVLFALRLIAREEASLAASQGESYRRYLAAVPRLVPALSPRLPPSGAAPNWLDGLLGESWMWGFTLALAALTATGDFRLYAGLIAASFAVYFGQRFVLRARRARPESPE